MSEEKLLTPEEVDSQFTPVPPQVSTDVEQWVTTKHEEVRKWASVSLLDQSQVHSLHTLVGDIYQRGFVHGMSSMEARWRAARAAKAITTLLAARRTDKWSDQKDADMTLTFNHAPATYPVPDHDPTHPWSAGAASRLRRAIEAKTEGATP